MSKWIASEVQLPPDKEPVLGYGDLGDYFITYYDHDPKFPHWHYIDNPDGSFTAIDIVAWMPLPEPYKPLTEIRNRIKLNLDFERCEE